MKTKDLYACGKEIIALSERLRRKLKRAPIERNLLAPVYGLLFGRFGRIDKEVHVKSMCWKWPKRIDFQRFGTNAVDIEFAVRSKVSTTSKTLAKTNRKELLKLTRRKSSQRYLFIVDISEGDPLAKSSLIDEFKAIHSGQGKFLRRNVRIVYVHTKDKYAFTWKPK